MRTYNIEEYDEFWNLYFESVFTKNEDTLTEKQLIEDDHY